VPLFAQRAAKKAAQTSKRTASDPRRSRRRLLQQNLPLAAICGAAKVPLFDYLVGEQQHDSER
jgi:hypothetical protein